MTKDSSDRRSDLEHILRRRRMTRHFDGGPDLEDVVRVAELALRAPSAGFSQGVHLVVLSDSHVENFWNRSGAGGWFSDRAPGVLAAPHVILVFGDAQEYANRYSLEDKIGMGYESLERWDTAYWIVDAAMVVENLLLLAEERRWGALFFGVHGNQDSYFSDLGVPETAHCIGAVAIGFRSTTDLPTGSPTIRIRRDPSEVVHIGRWSPGEGE